MPSVPLFCNEVAGDMFDAARKDDLASQRLKGLRYGGLSDADRKADILVQLHGIVGGVLGRDVGSDEPLLDAGLDSLGAVELFNTVQQSMGIELPTTLVFDYPNINAVAEYISDTLRPPTEEVDLAGTSEAALGFRSRSGAAGERTLCLRSMSSQSPGRSCPVEDSCGMDCSAAYARADFESAAWRAGPLGAYFGALIEQIEMFDSESFRMSQGEVTFMDPQQRLLLTGAWEALSSSHVHHPVGVFVGISSMDYSKVMNYFMTEASPYAGTGNALSVAAGRVSYMYGLQGPSVSTDTACSSSLVGSHVAYSSLLLGDCVMALSCGVNLTLAPDTGVVFKQAGMLSIEGRCKTLDADADGYVRGEACGVLLLDSMVDASASPGGDALICFAGSSVNQDGRSSALTAPNGPAQQRVISHALENASLTRQHVSTLHMHGTGTPLGDPIEMGAARAVLMHTGQSLSSSEKPWDGPLSVQAGKTFVGHTEPAAGAVGLIHAIHGIGNVQSSPVLHLRHVNPHLMRILPLAVADNRDRLAHLCRQQNAVPWSHPDVHVPHASGVSAFAFQGTNAHALVTCTSVSVCVFSSHNGQHWHKQRFWVGPMTHPLAMFVMPILQDDVHVSMYSDLVRPEMQWIWDHRVMGRVLFPGAGFMEAAAALVRLSNQGHMFGAAAQASIAAPLVLAQAWTDDSGSETAPVYLESKLSCIGGAIQVGSSAVLGGQGSSVHVRCTACKLVPRTLDADANISSSPALPNSPELVRGQCQSPLDWCQAYEGLSGIGLQYGPQFRSAWHVRLCVGKLAQGFVKSVPRALQHEADDTGMMVHPSALDGCLQLGAAVHFNMQQQTDSADAPQGAYVPAAFGAYMISCKSQDWYMYAVGESMVPLEDIGSASSVITNHMLYMSSGAPVCVLSGLEARQMGKRSVGTAVTSSQKIPMLYEVCWQSDLAFDMSSGTLRTASYGSVTVLAEQSSNSHMFGLKHVDWGRDGISLTIASAMGLFQKLADDSNGTSRLCSIAYGCLPSPWSSMTSSAPQWSFGAGFGMLRTLAQELPRHELHAMDMDGHAPSVSTRDMSVQMSELECAIRQNTLLHARLLHAHVPQSPSLSQLVPRPRGSLSNLVVERLDTGILSEGMVMLHVMAVGLNFRDVLNVLGAYPGDPGPPGSDMSGIVMHAGSSSLFGDTLVGTKAAGLAPGCLGTHAYTLHQLMVCIPNASSFVEACTMVTVFVTVDIALRHAGAIGAFPEQPVLVHAAAGGIGLAACQVVQNLGSDMWATAGSSLKRHLLRSMGVSHVLSSRSTDYAGLGQVRPDLAVQGMGFVLNSLTSSGMVGASLSCLHHGGQLVEIGKRDIWSTLAVHQERPDIVYSLVAVDFLPPSRTQQALTHLAVGMSEGAVAGLRNVCHPLNRTQAALRWLAGAKHVGKVVVSESMSTGHLLQAQQSGCTYVTGGMGALGSLVAQWAAQHMTPEVRLLGRSGHYKMQSLVDGVMPALMCLQDSSSSSVMHAMRCDAGSQDECGSALSWSTLSLPVAQVMHAGGLLADMLLGSQSIGSVRTVFAPKVDALHNLEKYVWGHSVVSQMLFSSVASLLGSAGQSNYSAANAYLDTWSCAHEAQGGCSTSIQWGAWSGGGMAVQSASTASRLELTGMQALSAEDGLSVLGSLLRTTSLFDHGSSVSLLAAVPIVWRRFLQLMPSVPLFCNEVARQDMSGPQEGETRGHTGFASQLARLSQEERTSQVQTYLTGIVGDVLGRDVGSDEPLMDAGLDSLGAVELHNTVQQSMGIELPTTLVFDYPDIAGVSVYISETLGSSEMLEEDNDVNVESVKPDWFIHSEISATIRLYCFSYAGGISEQVFAEWASYLPASVQVCPVELPAHGRRLQEIGISKTAELVESIALSLPFEDKPCAMFGLSTGAIVMYETVQWIANQKYKSKLENIIALLPAACPAPHLFPFFVQRMFASKNQENSIHKENNLSYDFDSSFVELMEYVDQLPKETVLDLLERTGVFQGIDKLRQSDDLYNYVMPGVISDSKLCMKYRPTNESPLSIPMISIYGGSDVSLGYYDVSSWQHYTTKEFKLYEVEGDHFFVNNGASKLKTMHIVADHLVEIHNRFLRRKASKETNAKKVQKAKITQGKADPSKMNLCSNTPIVFIVSPGIAEEDVVQIRSFMSWTSRGVYTLSGDKNKCVADLSTAYVKQILSMGFEGPFIIIGWSVGSLVAFEVAVKLERKSLVVDKLILMDGLHPIQLDDFGRCSKCPAEEKAQFVMQTVLQRHYMWPRFAKTWPTMTLSERVDEFLQIYSAIIGREFGKNLFYNSINYVESWWNFAALKPQEHVLSSKFEHGTLIYFCPVIRGGLPLVDDIFNINFQHTIDWNQHCNQLQVVNVPGDHFSMLPSSNESNLPFWQTAFKSFVEWHHNEQIGYLKNNFKYAQKQKKFIFPAMKPEIAKIQEEAKDLNCFGLSPRKLITLRSPKLAAEKQSYTLSRLKSHLDLTETSEEDQALLVQLMETFEQSRLEEFDEELRKSNQTLSLDNLAALPQRCQEILADSLGISRSSISKISALKNSKSTLRMVIKSYLKRRL